MLKKIITILMLIFFIISSSGVVIFAFECNKFNHSHFSFYHKVNCSDFKEKNNSENNFLHNNCHNEENNSENNDIYFKVNINNKYGIELVKILLLDIDTDIVHNDITKESVIIPSFYDNFLFSFFNINTLKKNNTSISTIFKSDNISLKIVKYIQLITSKASDDLPNIC